MPQGFPRQALIHRALFAVNSVSRHVGVPVIYLQLACSSAIVGHGILSAAATLRRAEVGVYADISHEYIHGSKSNPTHHECTRQRGDWQDSVIKMTTWIQTREGESRHRSKGGQFRDWGKWTITVTPADFYHQRAAECLALTHQTSDQHERGVMTKLANCWLRLLDRVIERRQ